ncbi:hypothetical protein RCL1_002214 [Eukaryota sp. TZLM3-RCL]
MSSIEDIFAQYDSALKSIDAQLSDSPTPIPRSSGNIPSSRRSQPTFVTASSVLSSSVAQTLKSSAIQDRVAESIAASKRALALSQSRYPHLFSKTNPTQPSSLNSSKGLSRSDLSTSTKLRVVPKRPPPPVTDAPLSSSLNASDYQQKEVPLPKEPVINYLEIKKNVDDLINIETLTIEEAINIRKNITAKYTHLFAS